MTGDPYEDFPEDQGDELTSQAIVKIATDLKDMGSKAFKAADTKLAMKKYEKGLRYLYEYTEPQEGDSPELAKQVTSLKFALHNNSALMAIKLNDFDTAISSATKAIEVEGVSDADKGKAYYRRGLARKNKKNEDEAVKDLQEALKCVPGDAAITKELNDVKKRAKDRAEKEKAQYKKFFLD